MNDKNMLLFIILAFFMLACDLVKPQSGAQLESRTMIIGGVPVHDKDYQLQQDQSLIHSDQLIHSEQNLKD